MRLRERSYHSIWTGCPSHKFKSRIDHTAGVACFFQLCQCYPIGVSADGNISALFSSYVTFKHLKCGWYDGGTNFLMKWFYLLIYLFFGQVVQHVDLSSPIRDWTQASCIGRRSCNHWTAREVPGTKFLFYFFLVRWVLLPLHSGFL